MRRKRWTGNGYRKSILFSTLLGKSIFFLLQNQTGKAHKNSKRRYSPCNWAIPPNLKLLPSNRKPLIFLEFAYKKSNHLPFLV